MRFGLWAAVMVVGVSGGACGGSNKPADSAADTSALESPSSSAAKEAVAPSDSSASASSAAPAASGASGKAAAEDAPAAPAAPATPAPAVTGSIDGKPFTPTAAHVSGKPQKDGRMLLTLDSAADCGSSSDAAMSMLVQWQDGYKTDLGSLKRGAKKGAEISFSRTAADAKKPTYSKTFKPSGTVTVVKATTDAGTVGKLKIDMQSGDFMLAGDLDVHVCETGK
jgi:hypothetical protein